MLSELACTPFVRDPCNGRTQGTVDTFDSLAYRTSAASDPFMPTCTGIPGIAACDKRRPAILTAGVVETTTDFPTVVDDCIGRGEPSAPCGTVQHVPDQRRSSLSADTLYPGIFRLSFERRFP